MLRPEHTNSFSNLTSILIQKKCTSKYDCVKIFMGTKDRVRKPIAFNEVFS